MMTASASMAVIQLHFVVTQLRTSAPGDSLWYLWGGGNAEPMAYQDGTGDSLKLLKSTLVRTFDFSGRSRRAEVIYYWIASVLANVVLGFAVIPLLSFNGRIIGSELIRFALSIPAFALFVRRVHDQNRNGAWIIVFIAFFALSITDGLRLLWSDTKPPFMTLIIAVGLILWVACMALTFLPGTNGPNKYGDDPRLE